MKTNIDRLELTFDSGCTCKPDLVLLRSVAQQAGGLDDTALLYGIAASAVPCMNSMVAFHAEQSRQLLNGGLRSIQKKLGKDAFPLIEQFYYHNHKAMKPPLFDGHDWPGLPCVVKIGDCHAGAGKIRVETQQQWDDVQSIVALHNDSATAERFIDWDYELRLQAINGHYRALKRVKLDRRIWKGNIARKGEIMLKDAEMTPVFESWLVECQKLFGGLQIFSLDVVHDAHADKLYILELNGTATGLKYEHEPEDHRLMRDMCIDRLELLEAELRHTSH